MRTPLLTSDTLLLLLGAARLACRSCGNSSCPFFFCAMWPPRRLTGACPTIWEALTSTGGHGVLVCSRGNRTLHRVFLTERPSSTRRTGHLTGVCLTWRQTGPTVLTACWKASPCYLIHFRFVLLPCSPPFICPSLCSAAASELSHTESSIIRPSSSVWGRVKEGGKWRDRPSTKDNKTHTAAKTSPILVLPFYCFKSGPKKWNRNLTLLKITENWAQFSMVQKIKWNKVERTASRGQKGNWSRDFVLSIQTQRSYTWILIVKRY